MITLTRYSDPRALYAVGYRLPSRANLRLHWRALDKMSKEQRRLGWDIGLRLGAVGTGGLDRSAKATITLTRIAPRKLDDDNLQSAFKSVRDGLADAFVGVARTVIKRGKPCVEVRGDDSDGRLAWRYAQEPGPFAIRVTVEIGASS